VIWSYLVREKKRVPESPAAAGGATPGFMPAAKE